MEQNLGDENTIVCRSNLERLSDNTKNLIEVMKEQKAITKELFILVENLLNELENKNALSECRDWVTYFTKIVKSKLEANVWFTVQGAVYRKIKKRKVDYYHSER